MPARRSNSGRGARRSGAAAAEAAGAALRIRVARLLDLLVPDGPVAVAVSGGPDSMALLHLAVPWAEAQGRAITVFTVDHGLRAGSDAEARLVVQAARRLGADAQVLTWAGPHPQRGVPAAARAARYRLLAAAARARGIGSLLLGHTVDDQAETFAMRLARGGGLDALAAMQAVSERPGLAPGVRLVRPLLSITRAELLAFLAAHGLAHVQDPSNADPRFERARVRAALASGAAGPEPAAMAAAARVVAAARDALDGAIGALALIRLLPDGAVHLDGPRLAGVAPGLRERAVLLALRAAGGPGAAPDADEVARLARALVHPDFRGATLAGVRILVPGGVRLLVREAASISGMVPLGPEGPGVWDGRWLVAGPVTGADLGLGALGIPGLQAVRRWPGARAALEGISAARLHVAPTVFRAGVPVAVPPFGLAAPGAGPGSGVALRLAAAQPWAPT